MGSRNSDHHQPTDHGHRQLGPTCSASPVDVIMLWLEAAPGLLGDSASSSGRWPVMGFCCPVDDIIMAEARRPGEGDVIEAAEGGKAQPCCSSSCRLRRCCCCFSAICTSSQARDRQRRTHLNKVIIELIFEVLVSVGVHSPAARAPSHTLVGRGSCAAALRGRRTCAPGRGSAASSSRERWSGVTRLAALR